ncbi:hypothetical protein MNBD_GAMMA11-1584 [hydrothermal vent metagenome]|uniref:Uncharacterized protein n=1 Tax=hydrothermal vent metagenome TaxID=652676 RepID=A0A3B0XDD4_9ZZZZ
MCIGRYYSPELSFKTEILAFPVDLRSILTFFYIKTIDYEVKNNR